MYYLIDGYNLIFSLTSHKKNLRTLREETVNYLQTEFKRKKIKGTLVFDGAHRTDEESGLSYSSPLIVAYAPKGQTADEYIIEKLEISKNPKIITVVTNDRGLIRQVKGYHAKVLANEEFVHWLKKKKRVSHNSEPKDSPKNIERLLKIFEKKLEEES